MGIFQISSSWWNPNSPKCRNCVSYKSETDAHWFMGDCDNEKFKGLKQRNHNSKACVQFKLNHERG